MTDICIGIKFWKFSAIGDNWAENNTQNFKTIRLFQFSQIGHRYYCLRIQVEKRIQILTSIVYSRKKHNCGHHIGCEKNSACRHKVLTRNTWKRLALLTWKILPSFLSAFARCLSNSFFTVVSCNTYEQNNIKRTSNNCAQRCITCWLEQQNCSFVALTHILLETRSCKSKEPNWEHIYKTSEKSWQ